MQKCLGSSCTTYANFGASTSTTTISYTIPDTTNLNWGSTYRFRVGATNICGTTYSSAFNYPILSSVPTAPATPTLVIAYENTLKVAWTAFTTAA
jgi:hypothetical protein